MKTIFTALLIAFTASFAIAQFSLVKDFNGTSASTFTFSSYDGFRAKVGDKVLLQYNSSGSTMMKSLNSSGQSESITSTTSRDESFGPTFYDFIALPNAKIAFIQNNDDVSYEVIVTDGTSAGTSSVYTSNEVIIGMEVITSGLFLTHSKESSANYELVKIDLSDFSSSNVIDFGSFYSISDISKIDDNTLVFMASDPLDSDKLKLYKSDGSSGGTSVVKEIYSGSGVSQQTVMTKVGSKVYFFYKESGVDCCNFLWVTDGTTAGTEKLKEFNLVPFVDYVRSRRAIAWNNKFYFMAVANGGNTNNDQVLWVSDGTTAGTIALHNSSDFNKPKKLTVFDNNVYFIAYDANSFNDRLYKTDGTVVGTSIVPVKYENISIYAYDMATDNSVMYLAGYHSTYSSNVFSFTSGVLDCKLADGLVDNAEPNELIVNGSDLYFMAALSATGREVYTVATFTEFLGASVRGASQMKLSVSPNPATSYIQVETEKQIEQMVLINAQGKELKVSSTSFMDLSEQQEGIYGLKVIFKDQTVALQKVIVSKL